LILHLTERPRSLKIPLGTSKTPPFELYLAYKRVAWMNKIQSNDEDDIIQKLTTQPEIHEPKRDRPKMSWWTNLKQSMTAIGIDHTCWPLSEEQPKKIHDEIRTPERMDAHYHRSKPLECPRCGRRYKYNTSYETHVSKNETSHTARSAGEGAGRTH